MKLSICIPTLDRHAKLRETLSSILPQIYSRDIEIVILDSSRHASVVYGKGVKYIHVPQCRGIRLAYESVVKEAKGEFVWLFCDDDAMKVGAVIKVMELIKHCDTLIVNAEVRDKKLCGLVSPSRLSQKRNTWYNCRDPHERTQFLTDVGDYLSYVGCIIVRKSLWLDKLNRPTCLEHFSHVEALFSPPHGVVMVECQPLISIRYGAASWRKNTVSIFMREWPKTLYSLDAVGVGAIESALKLNRHSFLQLLLMRATGVLDVSIAREVFGSKLLPTLVARIPFWPLNRLASVVVKHVLRKNPSIALYDLDEAARKK